MEGSTDLLTAHQLAEKLNVSVETVWRYTRQKRIPYKELGPRQYRYYLKQVMDALQRNDERVGESPEAYPAKKPFTYEDYVQLPEEPGYRFEVLEGCLFKDPSPVTRHQRCSIRLQGFLIDYFHSADPGGEILSAPLDVILSERTVLQPDLLYIPSHSAEVLDHPYIDIPPEMVIEILSQSTARKDRIHKMDVYRKAKIPHYWIVDPDAKTIEAFALREDHYALLSAACDDEPFQHPDFPDMEIPLGQVFVW